MRDKARIKPIIKELEEIWELAPDLRFGQLMFDIQSEAFVKNEFVDMFYVEDDKLLECLKEYKEWLVEYKKNKD